MNSDLTEEIQDTGKNAQNRKYGKDFREKNVQEKKVIHIFERLESVKNRVIHIVIHIIHIKVRWISGLHSIL